MNVTQISALIGSIGAVAGAGGSAVVGKLIFRRQHEKLLEAQAADVRSTADSRIIDAAADLVTQSGDVLRTYGERIARAEEQLTHNATEADRLRSELADVRATVAVVSADNAALRVWAGEIIAWAERAVAVVERLGGHIDPPPAPPQPRQGGTYPGTGYAWPPGSSRGLSSSGTVLRMPANPVNGQTPDPAA